MIILLIPLIGERNQSLTVRIPADRDRLLNIAGCAGYYGRKQPPMRLDCMPFYGKSF